MPAPTSLSLWLEAKLDFRSGKIAEAETAMAQAIRQMAPPQKLETIQLDYGQIMPDVAAQGDLGLLQVARSEFASAFQTFLDGTHWQDAVYIAERVFTVQELTDQLTKNFPWKETPDEASESAQSHFDSPSSPAEITSNLRWLLARRLARQEKFALARPYFPKALRPKLDEYAAALQKGRSEKSGNAYWQAAKIAYDFGMELFGTENEPDSFVWQGSF